MALHKASHMLVAIKKVRLLSDDKRIEKESELLRHRNVMHRVMIEVEIEV